MVQENYKNTCARWYRRVFTHIDTIDVHLSARSKTRVFIPRRFSSCGRCTHPSEGAGNDVSIPSAVILHRTAPDGVEASSREVSRFNAQSLEEL